MAFKREPRYYLRLDEPGKRAVFVQDWRPTRSGGGTLRTTNDPLMSKRYTYTLAWRTMEQIARARGERFDVTRWAIE